MAHSDNLPTEISERRRIQNRNAQRKYRSRRNQRRVSQVLQAQASSSSSDPPFSWPPASFNIWNGPHPQSYGFSTSDGSIPLSSEFPNSSEAGYSGGAGEAHVNPLSVLDISYSESESDVAAISYTSSLPDCSSNLGYNVLESFDMRRPAAPSPDHGGTSSFAASTDTSLSSGRSSAGSSSTANSTDTSLTSFSLIHGSRSTPVVNVNSHPAGPGHQGSLREIAADKQLYSYMHEDSSVTPDPTMVAAASCTSINSHLHHTHDKSGAGADAGGGDADDTLPILHIASHRGHDAIVVVLLSRDVDIDERDSSGRTALQLAAIQGHTTTAQLLLQRGAYIDATDTLGRTALHWATLQRNQPVVRVLLDAGADVNLRDTNGWTALHVAVERGFEEGLKLLLMHGADLTIKARKCENWKQLESALDE